MLGQFLFAYFVVGVMFVAFAYRRIPLSYRRIANRESRSYAFGLMIATLLYIVVAWPYAVYDATRPR
jgi:hypothetical protein